MASGRAGRIESHSKIRPLEAESIKLVVEAEGWEEESRVNEAGGIGQKETRQNSES